MSVKHRLDAEAIARRYLAGESLSSLRKTEHTSRLALHDLLTQRGIDIRPTTEARRLQRISPFIRYERFVDRRGTNECHPWLGGFNTGGYGQFTIGSYSTVLAHRWGYANLVGPIPPETPCVLHRCDFRPCQNPKHWFLGTYADNSDDKIAKGRQVNLRGGAHGMAILDDSAVRVIRATYQDGGVTQQVLADRFGVSRSAVSMIVTNATWTHLA